VSFAIIAPAIGEIVNSIQLQRHAVNAAHIFGDLLVYNPKPGIFFEISIAMNVSS